MKSILRVSFKQVLLRKRVAFIAVGLVFVRSTSCAYQPSICMASGGMFAAGATINTGSVFQGWQASPGFSYSIGGVLEFPIGKETEGYPYDLKEWHYVTFGYTSRSINFHSPSTLDSSI